MFSYLLGIMSMTIYDQTYGTSTITTLVNRYNAIMDSAMSLGAFSSMVTTIKTLAVGITILLYLIDLSSKVTEKNFSIEQFFKATLRCVTAYMFIMNSEAIVGYLIEIGSATADVAHDVTTGYDFFSSSGNKEKLINGIHKMNKVETLSYIAYSLLPWLLSMIGEVVIQVILISRIMEITVMTVFAPLAISDVYKEGTASPGVQYMKKMLALGMQIAVIVLINIATQAIIVKIVGADTGRSITELLSEVEYLGPGGSKPIYSEESIRSFLDAIVGKTDVLKVLGIMLARLGMIWNSMPLCEEITGAR